MIIGLSGYAQSGKNTVADILVDYHGFILMDYDESLQQTDRFVRWSYIILWCAGVFAFKLIPESDIYPFSIIFEFFKIIFYLLTFAFTSFSFLSFFVSIEIFLLDLLSLNQSLLVNGG